MANVGYFFHGFAGTQVIGDPKFYDISGSNNHGEFGGNLSNAAAWAVDGHVSTVNPIGGATDSVIRMPGLNLDYVGGEKFFMWWLGKVTAEGSAQTFLGDGISATYPGFRCRINSNQTAQLVLTSAANVSVFSENSEIMGDGNQHSFACVVDGANRSYGMWMDEIFEHSLFDRYVPFGAAVGATGPAIDTRNNTTFNIGTTAPRIAASADGIASQTRALAIVRFGAHEEVPGVPFMTEICKALRYAPGRLIQEIAVR